MVWLHTHPPAHSGGTHIVLLKSHSVMHISHLKHLTSLNWKQKKQGREQAIDEEGGESGKAMVAERGKAYGETGLSQIHIENNK